VNATSILLLSTVLALYYPFCTAKMQSTAPSMEAPLDELWQSPDGGTDGDGLYSGAIATRDLFNGPWGAERAPDPHAVYTFVERKQQGTNPGITVRDPQRRVWHVKQPPHTDQGAEGPIEVVLSRVLSAVGYHQPPVYFLPSLMVKDAEGTHVEPGGRFRLTEKSLKAVDSWSWQQNPFVGMRQYQGLLVILAMFNSSDLKNENNTLYELKESGDGPKHWYVVRDLGTALGETGRLAPLRGNPDIFERQAFILDVQDGFVRFNYHGWHQELLRHIAPLDLAFAGDLMEQLTDGQWADAFRAGGYEPPEVNRFIAALHKRIDEAHRASGRPALVTSTSR
jgi:hypothetical protein